MNRAKIEEASVGTLIASIIYLVIGIVATVLATIGYIEHGFTNHVLAMWAVGMGASASGRLLVLQK